MRQALVRATGRRESANDPALAGLVEDAPKYVKNYAPGPRGETQVVFDSAAVDRAIAAAGRGVWERDRPFTLVVLSPPPNRAAEDTARSELELAATARGLPISLLPLSIVDAAGNELGRDALLQLARRYGGDEILVGRTDAATSSGQWQWTLHTNFSSESWNGSLAAGIDGAVDLLAPAQGASLAQAETETVVEIDGVGALTDYANLQRMLEAIPGVRRANIAEANGTQVTFRLTVRGGAEAIDRALTGSAQLARTGTINARLVYQYHP
jgi:hypothetical protein